ncbi:MAG: magnesium transporter [Bacilli bacterium]
MEREEFEIFKENLENDLKEKNSKSLKEIFTSVPTIDIAEALCDVEDVTSLIYIFRVIPSEYSAELFAELTTEQQELIINSFTDKQLVTLLENSFADDIVDTIEEMPANLVARVLKVAPSDLRRDINVLLNYKENTAGSVMTTEYVSMLETTSVKDAIATLRKNGREAETIYTIFVRDSKRTLVGTVNLDDLLFANEEEKLSDIMDVSFVTATVNDDQEKVAELFKRYDLNAMAVVNSENKICGIITIDDVVDIIVEEATEDIALMHQTGPMDDAYLDTPILKLVKKCAPWIILLMVLQVFSTLILSSFQAEIAKFALLSVFTPLIMDAGGNSGGQTTTIIIRSIALNEFKKGDVKKVFWKEFRVASVIALIISTVSFVWIMIEMSVGIVSFENHTAISNIWLLRIIIATLVALTLFITMIASRMVGCSLPFLAKALKRDPAVMCGPLTTTVVDIIALLSYFTLWTLVFAPLLGL